MDNNLKTLRQDHGLTQDSLGKMLGVDQTTVSAWENGTRKPSTQMMQHIEDIFGVNKEEIFFEAFNYKMLLKELN